VQPKTSFRDFIRFWKLKNPREEFSRLFRWLVGALTPKFFLIKELDMVDKIVTSSNYLRNMIIRLGIEPTKIDTIYPFIDMQEYARDARARTDFRADLGISKDAPVMLYVGSTSPARLGGLLKALPIVLEEMPDSKIVLVSPQKKQFSSIIAQLDLQHAFLLLPQHVRINMARLIAASDVLIYLGYSAIVSVDPPRAIIEAMTLGVPIVASETGEIPDIVKDYENCLLVEPLDYKRIAGALIELLKKMSVGSRSKNRMTVHMRNEFDSRFAALHFISIYEHVMRARFSQRKCRHSGACA